MLIGKSEVSEFHRNPRKVWYGKLQDVTINGDYEATFELSEPQPSLPVLLASAFSVIYPCHIPQATMRTRPVGTGPFKLVEFNRGASIRLVRNPDYWKKDRPLSGRDHVSDDRQPRDADAGIRDRRIRYHLSGGYQRFPDEGCQGACAERDLRDDHHWHAIEPDGQPRQSAVRQSGDPQSHVAGDRSQGLQHDFDGRIGADGRGHAAEAGGRMGHAAGNGVVADGVWSRHRRKYRASPRDHAEAWLQRCQAAGNQDSDAKSSELSRSRGDRHRSAQEDLHRRRAGYSGNAAMVCAARAEGLHDRIERHRRQRRRSRRQYRRELFLQVGAQLYPVLQCRGGSTAGRAVPRTGQGEASENRLGYRASSGRRRGAPEHHLQCGRELLATLCQELHPARQQPIQQPAVRGRLAGQVGASTGARGWVRSVSYAGLTRVPINLRKSLAKKMGCLVKPGNGGSYLGRFVVPIKNSSMARAQRRPSRIAHTASDWPRRISLAENTLGREV